MPQMRAKQFTGAAILGLVASLMAHTVAFGRGHVMGAAYHQAFLGLAGLALAAFIGAAISLAWSASGRISEGSILAARLRAGLPRWPSLCASTTAWLLLVEAVEPRHDAAPVLLLIGAIVLASLVVLTAVRGLLAVLARIAVAVRSAKFAGRTQSWPLRFAPVPRAHRLLRARRLYTRPPPEYSVARVLRLPC